MTTAQTHPQMSQALPGLLARLGHAQMEPTLPEGRTPAMERLLREISETVLPRLLTLKTGDETLGTLLVSNRRLIAAGLGDDTPENADVATLAGILGLICDTEGATEITSAGRPAQETDPDSGASVTALRDTLAGMHDSTGVRVMSALIADQAVACLYWRGEIAEASETEAPAFTGDPDWHARLAALAASMQAGPSGGADGGLLVPLGSDLTLIACGDAQTGIAAITGSAAALKAMSDWQDLMGARSD